jgi:hypothetical protein
VNIEACRFHSTGLHQRFARDGEAVGEMFVSNCGGDSSFH